ncbi:hypothetical protein BH11PLA1_BH11PLA1_24180 [soil metagenome]
MSLLELQVFFQALAALAIASGLFYTGYQFWHSRRAQRHANFTKLVELQMHLREMRVSDPSLAFVYTHDVLTATTPREVREYFFNLMQMSVFEIVWHGHKHGQVDADYFASWESRMHEIAAESSFRRMFYSQSMKIMHDEFQLYMLALVRATPPRDAANLLPPGPAYSPARSAP